VIEIRNVSKSYNKGKVKAVDGLDLTVKAGEIFGFLGPNGAGKTTTIKMLTGLFEPSAGACFVSGYNVRKAPLMAKRCFGYVPDQPYLYDKLTGREFLHFIGGLFRLETGAVRRRVEEFENLFDLGKFIDKRAEEYSQGMRQRIVLSAALLHGPQVLIIDEPLVGLDPRSARLVKDTLKRMTADGMTIFMSTHLLEIVEELCDSIAIIKDGRIVYEARQTVDHRFDGRLEEIFLEQTR
jgi:ABC-2 type transport system ATP-binding protein